MSGITKEDYLKRYLSSSSGVENQKKKKKKKPKHITKSKIFDDDLDMKNLLTGNLSNTIDDDIGDDTPTVAAVIDERPNELVELEQFRNNKKWKIFKHHQESVISSSRHHLGNERHDTDSDHSHNSPYSDKGQSSAYTTKRRHDSESDSDSMNITSKEQIVNRSQGKEHFDSDNSPLRQTTHRHDSDSDISPMRRSTSRNHHHQSTRHSNFHQESDSDESPVRKVNDDSDQSPVRKVNDDSDQSPARNVNDNSDQSPARKCKSNSDQSPTRKRDKKSRLRRKSRFASASDSEDSGLKRDDQGRAVKTLGGAKAGISSSKDMKAEAKLLQDREERMLQQIGDDNLGKTAKTVFRDKQGKKRNLDQEAKEKAEEDSKNEAKQRRYADWGKGIAQRTLQERNVVDALHEAAKPLARYKDDEDLNELLKESKEREDPMFAFIKKKKNKGADKGRPVYKGSQPPPNRFGIWPGYRWDGVDRSTGFEKKIFSRTAEKKAVQEIAYKWSVEDM